MESYGISVCIGQKDGEAWLLVINSNMYVHVHVHVVWGGGGREDIGATYDRGQKVWEK